MYFRIIIALMSLVVMIQSAAAATVTIDTINVSTVFGYGDTHYPVPYPEYDRFSILGAAYTYTLSDGQVRPFGAGWIPYTNGNLASVSVTDGSVNYYFDQVYNWAQGSGTIFYSVGQVWCPSCNESGSGLWTEGQFAPVSPIILKAQLGSPIATLSGTARIVMNNASGNWGLPDNFVPFSTPEGSIVNYSSTYTLTDGSVWDEDIFSKSFSYNMTGTINLQPVPEPSTPMMFALGVGLILLFRKVRAGGSTSGRGKPGYKESLT